jgi:hypothetical protein
VGYIKIIARPLKGKQSGKKYANGIASFPLFGNGYLLQIALPQ